MSLGKTLRIAVLFGLLCGSAGSTRAATLYWDPAATFGDTGCGSGTWNTNSTANWWIVGLSDSPWTDVTGTDTATFGGTAGAYAVSVAGNITANALVFYSSGYTLSGGGIALAGATPTITANASATINSPLALGAAQTWTTAAGQTLTVGGPVSGGFGLTTAGSGTVLLTGSNSYTGGTTINSGTLQLGNVAALQNSTLAISGSGALSFGSLRIYPAAVAVRSQ